MARVSVPVTQLNDSGVTPPTQVNSDAANDHQLDFNDGRVFIECTSTDAGSQTVTIITPGTVGGFAVADNVITIPAGATRLIGPLAVSTYNQSDGTVQFDVAVGTLRFRAYRV